MKGNKEITPTWRDIRRALDPSSDSLAFGKERLYELCKKYPRHNKIGIVLAKIWIIGRTHSAAIERGSEKRRKGPDVYERTALAICKLDLDVMLRRLRSFSELDERSIVQVLRTHFELQECIQGQTQKNRRSFVSKYLHFHCPQLFPIFDRLAFGVLRRIELPRRIIRPLFVKVDKTYARFAYSVLELRKLLQAKYPIQGDLSPREIDRLLLLLEKKTRKSKR